MNGQHALSDGNADGIKRGLFYGGALILVAIGAKLAIASGWTAGAAGNWAQRVTMAITGLYIAVVGNAIPKAAPRMSAASPNQSRVQRAMRTAGWTWAIAGLALSVAWLALPRFADALTMILMPGAMVLVALQCVTLFRPSRG